METLAAYAENPHFYMILIALLFLGNVILTCLVFAALCTNGTASRNRAAQLATALAGILGILKGRASTSERIELEAVEKQIEEVLK